MYIISACLLGENCKYSGGNNRTGWVAEFSENHHYCPVCPEIQGGLPCPRLPAEILGDKVISQSGEDVTDAFVKGAELAWEKAASAAEKAGEQIEGAILKAKSPSCGCGQIYDGTFSGKLIRGDGCFTRLLKQKNIRVITEKEKTE